MGPRSHALHDTTAARVKIQLRFEGTSVHVGSLTCPLRCVKIRVRG